MKRISLEGNLAAGKSTLLNVLELLDESCEIAPEPVTQWQHVEDSAKIEDSTSHATHVESPDDMNILKQYYKDPHRWAHTF
jgi:deoxycitidine kinase